MKFFERLSQLWDQLCDKLRPTLAKLGAAGRKVIKFLREVWVYIIKLHKIILAVPVAWAAIVLALRNLNKLPALVGFDLQADGTCAIQMGRLPAVLAPLLITAVCLLLMFCSKRTLTPWLVSVFSLALPIIILVINVFPA